MSPSFAASQLSPAAGVALLPSALTINSVSPSPTLRYKGGDASAGGLVPWGFGPTLALQAGTAPTYNAGSPLLGTVDDSVLLNGGGYFLCADTTSGNVSTNDLVPHVIFRAVTTRVLMAKRNAVVGWEIGIDSSLRLYLTIQDASGATTTVSAALVSGSVYDGQIFADRNGSCQCYVNGAASGAAVDISARALTLDAAVALAVGADSGGASIYTTHGMLWELHQGAAWLDSHLQPVVAASRFALVEGLIASLNRGSTVPTAARASVAYLNKSGRLWQVGANWIRAEPEGTLIEAVATNLITQSGFAAWTQVRASVTATPVVLPDGSTGTANAIKDSVDTASHRINPAAQTFTNGVLYQFSVYAKTLGYPWLAITADGGTNFVWFNSLTGAVGTQGTGMYGRAETLAASSPGWFRFTLYSSVLNGATNVYIFCAPSDAVTSYTGTNTDRFALMLPQIEVGDVTSSPIVSAGAAAARAADSLYYPALGNLGEGQGALRVDFYVPYGFTSTVNRFLASASIGASTADAVSLYVDTSGYVNGTTAITTGAAGAVQLATSVLAAAGSHRAVLSWRNNELRLWVDGVQATPDVTCAIPALLTRINIGSDGALANQSGQIRIVRWRAYDRFISAYNKAG
jgi:hypothetical protein